MPRTTGAYKSKSNIITSLSVKLKDEHDYLELRDMLDRQRISLGEYLISSYRELDKGIDDPLRLRAIKWS
tara:strand:+ start:977 stop:1186 length:210 start_codon:yes stop_codon:yes gene_type:complete